MISLIIIIISFSLILAFTDIKFVPEINAQIIPASQLQQDPCLPGWSLGSSGRCEEVQTPQPPDPCPSGWSLSSSTGRCEEKEPTPPEPNGQNGSTIVSTFQDPETGETFQHPSNWQVRPIEKVASALGIPSSNLATLADQVIANLVPVELNGEQEPKVHILMLVFRGDTDLERALENQNSNPDNKIQSVSKTTLDGHPAYEIVYQTGELFYLHTFSSTGYMVYDITYFAPPDLYNKYLPDVRQIVNSFKVPS